MDKELLKKSSLVLGFASILSLSVFLYNSQMKKNTVKSFLFEKQINLLVKNYGLTKPDSTFIVKTLKPIVDNPNITTQAKVFLEYADSYKSGVFTRDVCVIAFDRFYAQFAKEVSKKNIDSLYTVLNKYQMFKKFEKDRKSTELIFKRTFRNYFFKKYLDPKPKPKVRTDFRIFPAKSIPKKKIIPRARRL